MADVVGEQRTALRITPGVPANDMVEHDVAETYTRLLATGLPLAYLHVVEADGGRALLKKLRAQWRRPLMLTPRRGSLSPHESAADALALRADLVSFATSYVANPDLVERLLTGGPYNAAAPATFFGGDRAGYTDYPALAGQA